MVKIWFIQCIVIFLQILSDYFYSVELFLGVEAYIIGNPTKNLHTTQFRYKKYTELAIRVLYYANKMQPQVTASAVIFIIPKSLQLNASSKTLYRHLQCKLRGASQNIYCLEFAAIT
jgi:hypothetical protein